MFVLEFFTVYPDSVSDKIILLNKKLLDKHYIGIILVATMSPLSRKSIFFVWWRHKSKSNRKTSVVITDQILFLDTFSHD